MEFERYFQLSITPNSHIIEDHSCEQQSLFNGIGDLEESFGELNHPYKSIDAIGSTLTLRTLVALQICNPMVYQRLMANVFEQRRTNKF